jgi:N-acetylneuraminic acid mutarotase
VVHKNKLWLIGGRTGAGITTATDYQNDVWSSADGNTWTQVTTTTAFTGRWGHQVVSYNNELFLIGGETVDGVQNDMWVSSDDGVNWTKIVSGNPRALPANFAGRAFFTAFVQDNTIWMVGGRGVKENSAYTIKTDIWKGKLVK